MINMREADDMEVLASALIGRMKRGEIKEAELEPNTKIFGYIPIKKRELNGGVQYKFKFQNGYGASVIRHEFSYGSSEGLWELAVLDSEGELTYTTPITKDVIGYMTEEEVEQILTKIKEL